MSADSPSPSRPPHEGPHHPPGDSGSPEDRKPRPVDHPAGSSKADAPTRTGSRGTDATAAGDRNDIAGGASPGQAAHEPPVHESGSRAEGGERYNVLRTLGEGGFGVVYLAEDRVLKQKVAIKVLHLGNTDERNVQRFIFEAQTAANLRHSGIVNVFDIIKTDDGLQQVMEYYPGGTLKEVLEDEGALPPKRALEITLKVLDALGFAHNKGFIHRDIKPANIFFAEDGSIKIGDFGLCASFESHDYTLTGEAMGTPLYMAPEQMKDAKNVDQRADIYSVGLTLYHMLTGERPMVIDLSVIPASMRSIITRVTAQDRDKRLGSCEEFRAMIEEVLPLVENGSTGDGGGDAMVPADLFESASLNVGPMPGETSRDQTRSSNTMVEAGRTLSLALGAGLIAVVMTFGIVGGYLALTGGSESSSSKTVSTAMTPESGDPGAATDGAPVTPTVDASSPAAGGAVAVGNEASSNNDSPVPSSGAMPPTNSGLPPVPQGTSGLQPPPHLQQTGGAPTNFGGQPGTGQAQQPFGGQQQFGQPPRQPTGGQPMGGHPPGGQAQGGIVQGLPFFLPQPSLRPIGEVIRLVGVWVDSEDESPNSMNLSQAQQMLTGGMNMDSANPVYPYMLGRIAERLGDRQSASQYYARVKSLSPEFMQDPGGNMLLVAEMTGAPVPSSKVQPILFGRPPRSLLQ